MGGGRPCLAHKGVHPPSERPGHRVVALGFFFFFFFFLGVDDPLKNWNF